MTIKLQIKPILIHLFALILFTSQILGCSVKVYPISQYLDFTPADNFVSESTYDRTYIWDYQGIPHRIEISIKKSFYNYFQQKKIRIFPDAATYAIYVTHPVDDNDLNYLSNLFKYIALSEGYDAKQLAGLIISFVRSLPYISDLISTGLVEHPKFPIETLVDQSGDCEDSSFLLAALLSSAGFNTCLLASDSHMAVGISVSPDQYPYFDYEGKHYYYIESTQSRIEYAIGQIPSTLNASDFAVIPLIPRPLVLVDHSITNNQSISTLHVTLQNLGSFPINNADVSMIIMDQDQNIIFEHTSLQFDLNIDETANASYDFIFKGTGNLIQKIKCNYYSDSEQYQYDNSYGLAIERRN